MAEELIVGEFRRTLDDRYRVSIPGELLLPLGAADGECLLAKERPGALSLWPVEPWQSHFADGIKLIQQRIQTGRLSERITDVQLLGRLLSTRQRKVPIAGRGRLVVPEGFREFLGAEPGSDLLLVGAAICIEIWRPDAWTQQLEEEIPRFRELYDDLSA
jgi:MraZ protein